MVIYFVNEKCKNGWQESNLCPKEKSGMKEIKQKIRNHDIVVGKSDKCGKLTIDSTSNYLESLKVHTESHTKIDLTDTKKIENTMNSHLLHFNKMFNVGAQHEGHELRVTKASTTTNVLPPPLYGFRKTHKTNHNGDNGPPMRPVCGAKDAPNSRFSNFLSKIIYDVWI